LYILEEKPKEEARKARKAFEWHDAFRLETETTNPTC
jgi:hypothetical protein